MPGSHHYQLITFDVYTALFDIEGSLAPLCREFLTEQVDVKELVRLWRQKQLEYTLMGMTSNQILHVAGSATDVIGAKAAGLQCAWSNRKQDKVLGVR